MTNPVFLQLANKVDPAKTIEICRKVIQTRSITGNERDISELVARYLEQAGLQIDLVKHDPQRTSVIAILKGSGEKPALLFSAHMDTVPPGEAHWQHDPFSADLAEGKIWGRGASDMKSGLAALMIAAETLARSGLVLKGDLYLAFSAGEEMGLVGAKELAPRLKAKGIGAALIAEPSSNEIVIAEKGAFWLELITYGKTAHGSMPDCGRNAVIMMLALLNELQELTVESTPHGLIGEFTRSINTISGGIGTNVVPDLCRATIDMRTVPGQDHYQILKKIQDLINRMGNQHPDFKADVNVLVDYPPLAVPEDDPFARLVSQAASTITTREAKPKGVRYFSDGAVIIPALEIPWVICGPGIAELAHQPNEYVETEKLVEAARIYTLAASQYLL